jgi:outer membrane protein assembly factor BamD (BamD/ComL family)
MTLGDKRALKVFLCHASGDKPQVRVLYKRLVVEGVDVWLDQEKLLPGQDWRVEIPRAVKEADVVVVCLSNKSITKEGYIQKEIKSALDAAEEKPDETIFLIPARLEDCPVPEKISRWQWVDLFEENGYEKLLRSLKLRANIVGAVVTPLSYEDDDDETERRLDQYYTEGLAAFYTEDWSKACQRFQLILSERPGDKKAIEKFEEAERQRDLSKLYAQSVEACQAKDWQTAIKTLDELLKKSPSYKDSAELYKNAKKQKQLGELYVEAKKLHAAKKWEAVLKVFEQIFAVEPNHPDSDELLSSAQKEVAELKRLADLNELYRRAVREMESGKWYEARNLLEQVHKAQTGFLETESLLKKVEDEILKIEKINERNNQINTLLEQAHGLIRSKNWRNALDKIEEIQKLDGQFEDKDGITEKAKAELAREEQEVQKQNQLAAMYADAVRLLKEGKYQEALDKWNEVKAVDSKYPDRQQVQKMANKKLAELNKDKRGQLAWLKNKSLQTWGGIILLVFVALVVVAIAIPIKIPVTTIKIPANTSYGVQYQAPLTGYYTFQYVDSAWSAYNLSNVPARPWGTLTLCYSGRSSFHRWPDGGLDETGMLFKLGSTNDFLNKEAAIVSTHGAQKKVHLANNEWMTCVVSDSYYLDNSGEIILDVYYSLR